MTRIYLRHYLHAYPDISNSPDHLASCVPPLLAAEWFFWFARRQPHKTQTFARTRIYRYWNVNQLCIDYASRPRLSSRLTLGGLAFPRNPWTFDGGVSHSSLATNASIRTRIQSTHRYQCASLRIRRSPTTHTKSMNPYLRLCT